MSKMCPVLAFAGALAASAVALAAAAPETPIVVTGFAMPESVVHDQQADLYIVSNFG